MRCRINWKYLSRRRIKTTARNQARLRFPSDSRAQTSALQLPQRSKNCQRINRRTIRLGRPLRQSRLFGNDQRFLAPFGIWLPRHSEDQVKEVGTYIDLQGLDPEQKEKIILEKGIPYLSLLWRKGHVMLYIGEQNDHALIFHNVWGIKTIDLSGREGRKIIGKAVITTLYPGEELNSLDPEGLLIKNISAMSIVAPVTN